MVRKVLMMRGNDIILLVEFNSIEVIKLLNHLDIDLIDFFLKKFIYCEGEVVFSLFGKSPEKRTNLFDN